MNIDDLLNAFARQETASPPPAENQARAEAFHKAWQRVEHDPTETRRVTAILADLDDVSAAYDLGERAEAEGDLDVAEWAFRQAAAADFGDAVYRLALVHARKAKELFATALASGIPEAAEHLDIQHPDEDAVVVRGARVLALLTSLSTTNEPDAGHAGTPADIAPADEAVSDLTHLDLHIHAAVQAGETIPCRTYDPEVFFAETPADVEFAKSLCAPCPIREACLHGAIERREPWGVWGGELFVQGVVVPRKRPRGRPRPEQGGEAAAG